LGRWIAIVVLALVASGFSTVSANAGTASLKLGSVGTTVTTLQKALEGSKARSYFNYPVFTQKFGSVTQAGLRTWETDNRSRSGVKVDGIITPGSAEWNLLMAQRRSTAVKIDSRCLTGRVICASVQERKIRYYESGKLLYSIDARVGRIGDETRSGNFYIYKKKVDVVSNIYHTPMPYSIFFSGGQAVHLSASFTAVGWYFPGSYGCINIRDKATLVKIFNRVRPGYDRVVVYNK
jgi:hypothetical protein